MDIIELESLVNSHLSSREIAEKLNISQSTVMYWLKRFNLTLKSKKKIIYIHTCKICNKEIKNNERNRSRCGSCNTRLRRLKNKIRAIQLLGGQCKRCGYNNHFAALQFHHKNPENKKFEISRYSNKSWNILKKEVLKCELLCANCHIIEHSNRYDDKKLLMELKQYRVDAQD